MENYHNSNKTDDYSRAEAAAGLASADELKAVEGLLTIVFCDDDREWGRDLCVEHSKSQNENIRGIAILCFGHLAQIHRQIDRELVMPIVQAGLNDPSDLYGDIRKALWAI